VLNYWIISRGGPKQNKRGKILSTFEAPETERLKKEGGGKKLEENKEAKPERSLV
jgi:hypothetical protein